MFDRFRRPREPEFVFVVTFGRSGSTLIQGLLNTLPRTLVRGENGFFLGGFFAGTSAATAFAERHAKHRPGKPVSAFYGVRALTPERFARHVRALSTEVLLGKQDPRGIDRLGFKEVLWHQIEEADTAAFFDWFDLVFPGAKYVLNTRNVSDALGSGFWQKRDPDHAVSATARVQEIQAFLRETRSERVFDTSYEVITGDDVAASDAQLRGLATFVTGGCSDELLAELRATLAVGHGPAPFGKSRADSRG
ncbi:sulfotransferase [Nocardioides sp. Kera G14]|uniref:sulfotransferase n=1 Tax=Nocardioides sp. Kera G14 TaxID=2884264 RepID=UPI001D0F7222|nr:sulfotransferase [Nocardioides sp. Kera G14]UDY24547.1 sulfotransferase [Nocardioides sp. Kera G14]